MRWPRHAIQFGGKGKAPTAAGAQVVAVAFTTRPAHDNPQPPQFVSELSAVSQPVTSMPSQSPTPGRQAPIRHVPVEQSATAPGREQATARLTPDGGLELRVGDVFGLPEDLAILVDEAYFDFVDRPDAGRTMSLARERPNLLVTRTFSKAHARGRLPHCALRDAVRGSPTMAGPPSPSPALAPTASAETGADSRLRARGLLFGRVQPRCALSRLATRWMGT